MSSEQRKIKLQKRAASVSVSRDVMKAAEQNLNSTVFGGSTTNSWRT